MAKTRFPSQPSRAAQQAADEQLSALAQLKGRLRADKPAVPARPSRPRQASHTVPEDDGGQLFRASLTGVQPLALPARAELDLPKPVAMPKLRPVAELPGNGPVAVKPAEDLFQAAYRDVTPLADSGRREPWSAVHLGRAATPEPVESVVPPAALLKDPVALFRHAMRGAAPLPDKGRIEPAPVLPPAVPRQHLRDCQEVLRETLEAPLTFEDRLDMGDEAAFLRPGLPRRILTDLRRGRWVTQGELDLHGMTRDEAREALGRFLAASLQFGRRCIRLIHGKGLGSPGREPVLKHLSKSWLSQREEILAYCQARPHEGGAGALLVLLRAGQGGGNRP